ncbi:hypothetical protein [Deinococcus cellulosilyticus]|uniref:Uncharacterized protein n=1 Tax=Deinococcus cellulosilyticus (strain DSM 18568 / NBRC 106333 / KACC 11606 / 5516J-15) TaxID=1223518 RepID=A0A511N3D8_DEIC1|nr:hypothetical protein [Deinococcus cellulosilyticus]GEM47370.1 hypothetical protein DC3_30050 [Deinococcus cellulosilyticus NBRC 106333 = KACC 11606]
MEFDQNTADFLAQEVRHIIQNDSNYEVSTHLSDSHMDLTVQDGVTDQARGVILRFSRAFLQQTDRLAALEALDQHLRYALQEGLQDAESGQYPVMDIPAVQ